MVLTIKYRSAHATFVLKLLRAQKVWVRLICLALLGESFYFQLITQIQKQPCAATQHCVLLVICIDATLQKKQSWSLAVGYSLIVCGILSLHGNCRTLHKKSLKPWMNYFKMNFYNVCVRLLNGNLCTFNVHKWAKGSKSCSPVRRCWFQICECSG